MKTLQEKRRELLDETCKHFNSTNRSVGRFSECKYGGVGCAIGRKIPNKRLCDRLDGEYTTSVDDPSIFNKLPAKLKELGQDFLTDLQKLHDEENNWNEKGLSKVGKAARTKILKTFKL
jgi:hypothetical protein